MPVNHYQNLNQNTIHKLEFLCLKWAITDQFHEYLYGTHLMSIQLTTP